MTATQPVMEALFLTDETAWLEETAALVAEGRFAEIDAKNLSEYLTDMAKRDRREVKSRLVVLLVHLLKWHYQPELRSKSWQMTIIVQRNDLKDVLESRRLYNHAVDLLDQSYRRAREHAEVETGIDLERFSKECPWTLDEILTAELD